MKKLGFGKKGDGDDDSNRSALFGSRSKNKSPNPSTNPYAQPPSASDPYNQAKLNAGVGGVQRGPSPSIDRSSQAAHQTRQGGYGAMDGGRYGGDHKYGSTEDSRMNGAGGGYGPDKYGAQSGYGADRYGTGASSAQSASNSSRYGPGGYGGLGSTDRYKTAVADDSRDALFGGARERLQQNPQPHGMPGQPPPYGADYGQDGQSGAYGGGSGPTYEA
jgi:protein transport protein SEC9